MEEDKKIEQKSDSVVLLNKLMVEYEKYGERILNEKSLSEQENKFMRKGIWGCIQIAKELLNDN
jgi:hypothetical protein